jgi:hypothetical protein
MERRFIKKEDAVSLLNDGDSIHTFRNPNGILLGCDNSREYILQKIQENESTLELGGDACRSLNHGLVIEDESGLLFIETNEEKLKEFDPLP